MSLIAVHLVDTELELCMYMRALIINKIIFIQL